MNLSAEMRKGYLVSEKMKKVWNIEIKLLTKLLEVCEKYNLKIWADGGTLIGAVREKGFIPWDDDIDMVMLRSDYDRLLKIAPSEFQEPFFFQNAYTDKFYPRGHSQLRYNGTAAVLPGEVHCTFNQSIFIDIFVYDVMPKRGRSFYNAMLKAEKLRKLMLYKALNSISLRHSKSTLVYVYGSIYFFFHSFQEVFTQFQNCYAKFDEPMSDVCSCPCFNITQVFSIRRKLEWYSDTLYMPFEDIMIPVPIGYDEILKNEYGDYMTPVKAPTMHGSVIFDPDRSYVEVLKDLKSGKLKLNADE
jgi:lipopolysaccharide cholinephosphotransferase